MSVTAQSKKVPFSLELVRKIAKANPTPFYLYDEKAILENAQRLNAAFSWAPEFKNYFAVKATPNIHLMRLLNKAAKFGADCSSLAELILAQRSGLSGQEIMLTSNDTPVEEFQKALELGAIINLDDISHIEFIEQHLSLPQLVCARYNPGPLREGNVIIGKPEDAKYGFTRDQLFQGYKILKEKGVKRFGLHTMVASNELNPEYFVETARMLFELVLEISKQVGIRFEFINIGGGIGIPYRLNQTAVDYNIVGEGIKNAYQDMIVSANLAPLNIYMECGRVITGPYGYLVSTALHKKEIYKNYVGLDACMANLMRPAMYGAYHHITVLGKEDKPLNKIYDVTGSLCENNDKFAVDRPLPEITPGDILVIHDSGAHGHAMGFNYNGKLRCAEFLLRQSGEVVKIRRAETIDDYFATLDFAELI